MTERFRNINTSAKAFLIFTLIIILMYIFYFRVRNNSLKINGVYSCGKVIRSRVINFQKEYYYEYFYLNKKYTGNSYYQSRDFKVRIGGFYRIRIDTTNPNNSEIYLDDRLLDTMKCKD